MRHLKLVGDEKIGGGGFLYIRRLRFEAPDGRAGIWDFVERPMGLDAVVLALYDKDRRVLLRTGGRIPVEYGRPDKPPTFPELVAGIAERGEEDEGSLKRRAAAEALEEAGLHVAPEKFVRLGNGSFPTPGMCAEAFHFFAAEVPEQTPVHPKGDGSLFEEGATVEWVPLDEALQRDLRDMKTELGLRRLRDYFTTLSTRTSP